MNETYVATNAAGSSAGVALGTLVATTMTAVIFFFTALFALLQVRAARKGNNTQFMVGMYEDFYSADSIRILRAIYKAEGQALSDLLAYGHRATDQRDKGIACEDIDRVLDWYNMIGESLRRGMLDEGHVIGAFGGAAALRCWHKLRWHILARESERGDYYLRGMKYFARRVARYELLNTLADGWIRLYPGPGREAEGVNLIEKQLTTPRPVTRCELFRIWVLRGLLTPVWCSIGRHIRFAHIRCGNDRWLYFYRWPSGDRDLEHERTIRAEAALRLFDVYYSVGGHRKDRGRVREEVKRARTESLLSPVHLLLVLYCRPICILVSRLRKEVCPCV